MAHEEKLQNIPEEVRARIAAMLLKSIGGGPIEAPGNDDEDSDEGLKIMNASMGELEGALAFLASKAPQRRPATRAEVMTLNRRTTPLKVGDRVRWKPGHHLGEWPHAGQSAIVSQVIDPPLYDTSASDTGKGAQRNDIALAFADDGGEDGPRIFEFVYDSRRFERVEKEEE